MHVLYVKTKVNVEEHLFFLMYTVFWGGFFCSWSCFCVHRGKNYVDGGKMAGSCTKFLKPSVTIWAAHTLHTSCDFIVMSHVLQTFKTKHKLRLPGADVSCLTDCFFSISERFSIQGVGGWAGRKIQGSHSADAHLQRWGTAWQQLQSANSSVKLARQTALCYILWISTYWGCAENYLYCNKLYLVYHSFMPGVTLYLANWSQSWRC